MAELVSNDLYGYGFYSARMKLPDAPASIAGFFLYQPPDCASEIDIEIYNDPSRRIIFSTYSGGRQTYSQTLKLPFDLTTGYQDYSFDRAPGSVKFYVDGRLMRKWTIGTPGNSTRLYVNAWYPSWLKGQKPSTDWYLLVDSIQQQQQGSGRTTGPRRTG